MVSFSNMVYVVMKSNGKLVALILNVYIYQTDFPDSIYALQFHWYVDFNWLASQPHTAVDCNFRQKSSCNNGLSYYFSGKQRASCAERSIALYELCTVLRC